MDGCIVQIFGPCDYGFRFYDPAIGRFTSVDPAASKYSFQSPYAYIMNNPIRYADFMGLGIEGDFYDQKGNYIGTDGIDDGKAYVVTNRKEAKSIKKTNKKGGTTSVSDVGSAKELPSMTALGEAINVLDRTIAGGGLKEESSIVMNDGTILRGETGSEPVIEGGYSTATASLPDLPEGTTPDDAEATIHSHPTVVQEKDGMIYPQSASVPSATDKTTFSQYNTHIIVGPLGTITSLVDGKIPSRPNGVVIYDRASRPKVSLTRSAAEKIVKRNK